MPKKQEKKETQKKKEMDIKMINTANEIMEGNEEARRRALAQSKNAKHKAPRSKSPSEVAIDKLLKKIQDCYKDSHVKIKKVRSSDNDKQDSTAYKNDQNAQDAKSRHAVSVTFPKQGDTPETTLMVTHKGIFVDKITEATNRRAAELFEKQGIKKVFLDPKLFKEDGLLDHAYKVFKAKGIEVVNYKPQEQKQEEQKQEEQKQEEQKADADANAETSNDSTPTPTPKQ